MVSATHERFLAIDFQEAEPHKCCNLRAIEVVGLGQSACLLTPSMVRDFYQVQGPNSKSTQDCSPPLCGLAVGSQIQMMCVIRSPAVFFFFFIF